MAAESITGFVQRFVVNQEDLEFLVLYLDGLGVHTLTDLAQLPERSWETLSAWLSPGTAPALRAELRCLVPPSGRSMPEAAAQLKSSSGGAVTSPPRRPGPQLGASQPLSASSAGLSSRDPDAIRRSDKGSSSRDGEPHSYPPSPSGPPSSNAPVSKSDLDASSKRTTRAQGIISPTARSSAAAAAAVPAPVAALSKSTRDMVSSSPPPSSPLPDLARSHKDAKPRRKTEESLGMHI